MRFIGGNIYFKRPQFKTNICQYVAVLKNWHKTWNNESSKLALAVVNVDQSQILIITSFKYLFSKIIYEHYSVTKKWRNQWWPIITKQPHCNYNLPKLFKKHLAEVVEGTSSMASKNCTMSMKNAFALFFPH